MNQMLIGVIFVMGVGGFFLWEDYQGVKQENMALTVAVAEQKQTITAMKESYEKQGQSLQNMMRKNAQIEQEMNSYLDIFRRHNLNQLAVAKPGMIEKRVNNATKQVFESIENDSKELDSLDDPTSDINPNN